jgi:hypothetical protein
MLTLDFKTYDIIPAAVVPVKVIFPVYVVFNNIAYD